MARGRFITLEGGEGTGKTTQALMLADSLGTAGIEAVTTREPGGSHGAERIRTLLVDGDPENWSPMTEALLHFAARRDHIDRIIEPVLADGRWVICDRFTDSTMAYQGYAGGLDRGIIAELQRLVIGDLTPDLTLILDLPTEDGLARAKRRGEGEEDRYERMGQAFHERLRDGFLDIAKREPDRCRVIAATGTAGIVHDQVCAVVAAKFGLDL
jgi:dTMP kinase